MRFFNCFLNMAITFGLLSMGANVFAHEPGAGVMTDEIIVTRHFTGLWDQVDQEAQGIVVQVVEQSDNSRRSVAYWYTYGPDRKTAWFVAIGDLIENRIEFDLYDSTDVGFMQVAIPGHDSVNSIGTMTMTFENCNSGMVAFETSHSEVGSGSFRIERLTDVMNTHCSGGVSDDMHADSMRGEQRVELTAARDGISGRGYLRHENFPGHIEFQVGVEGLADGDYHLFAGMQERGDFQVHSGRGELAFASPGEDGKMLLNFDPRGMRIEIHDAAGAVLSSFNNMLVTDEDFHNGRHGNDDHNYDCQYGSGSGHGMGGMGGMQDCVDDGDYIDLQADLENTGILPEAGGSAEWDMNSHRIQFSVEINNVPAGLYTLNVSGEDVGVIEAVQMHLGVYGHISFRDPEAYGMRLLDFEPRDQIVKVLQGNSVILEVEFPAQ